MSSELLTSLLKEVSRSFYLTMRVLPGAIRSQISLAYLLARTTDTIADTEIISAERRLQALEKLRARILGTGAARLDFGELARHQASSGEKVLLERCEDSLALLLQFSKDDRQRIREVLDTITSGQELDLKRFAGANEKQIVALQTESELDDYTYRVAGCVGEFWTKTCLAHQFSNLEIHDDENLSENSFEELGVRFGKGLQLVNILRDLPRDLRNGRCYLPADKLAEVGLAPADLLQPVNETKLHPLYHRYLDLAESHLAAGWKYTNLIPRGQMRLRLACAWPILIGAMMMGKLRSTNILNPAHHVKVSRGEVKNLIAKSFTLYPFARAWESQFAAAKRVRKCC
ncbi:MAG: phytoene/squalene synthase family protein [Verrucomicrobiota bacterium]